jgi:hypothetical protein
MRLAAKTQTKISTRNTQHRLPSPARHCCTLWITRIKSTERLVLQQHGQEEIVTKHECTLPSAYAAFASPAVKRLVKKVENRTRTFAAILRIHKDGTMVRLRTNNSAPPKGKTQQHFPLCFLKTSTIVATSARLTSSGSPQTLAHTIFSLTPRPRLTSRKLNLTLRFSFWLWSVYDKWDMNEDDATNEKQASDDEQLLDIVF